MDIDIAGTGTEQTNRIDNDNVWKNEFFFQEQRSPFKPKKESLCHLCITNCNIWPGKTDPDKKVIKENTSNAESNGACNVGFKSQTK